MRKIHWSVHAARYIVQVQNDLGHQHVESNRQWFSYHQIMLQLYRRDWSGLPYSYLLFQAIISEESHNITLPAVSYDLYRRNPLPFLTLKYSDQHSQRGSVPLQLPMLCYHRFGHLGVEPCSTGSPLTHSHHLTAHFSRKVLSYFCKGTITSVDWKRSRTCIYILERVYSFWAS